MPSTRSATKGGDPPAEEALARLKEVQKPAGVTKSVAPSQKNKKPKSALKEQQTEADHQKSNDGKTSGSPKATSAETKNNKSSSTFLERGIIYFFFRGRVNIEEPHKTDDIARSYFILRPFAKDAKLSHGPIEDVGNSRLCAIPKKVLPTSGKDKWIVFVEKSGTSFEDLKKTFLASNDYMTKTAGSRHTPAATPIGEGVYAITATGRESHLAYMLTLPKELGEVQRDIGLKEQGSFIISTRNPNYPPPKYAQLPEGPQYSKEIIDQFRALRWMGTIPEHLDYPNTQFLLIGEPEGIDKATDAGGHDNNTSGDETMKEEMEELEQADVDRMKHLGEDDSSAIFADLHAHAEDYPGLQTTF